VEIAQQLAQMKTELQGITSGSVASVGATAQPSPERAYWQNRTLLQTLNRLTRLAREIVQLPQGDERTQRTEQLAALMADTDPTVKAVLGQLGERIAAQVSLANTEAGATAARASAHMAALDALRRDIIDVVIRLGAARSELGLPSGGLPALLSDILTAQTEELLASATFRAVALDELKADAQLNPTNDVFPGAIAEEQAALTETLNRLRDVLPALRSLSLPVDGVEKALLTHSQTLSTSLLEPDTLASIVIDAQESFMLWLQDGALDLALQIVLFIAIVLLARWLATFARATTRRLLERSAGAMSSLLRDILVSIVGGIVLTVGVLVALAQVGISVAPMLAGLGVAGFVIGFALQDTLGNFAAGAMILAYRPFDMGDYISVAGIEGSVQKMTLVSTTITTVDNQTLIVPNSKIWGDVIRNYSYQDKRRVDIEFGIGYDDDIEKAETVLKEIIASIPAILQDPEPVVRLHRLGESSVDFVTRSWVLKADYWETYWTLLKQVKTRFDAEGISIPFPQRDVHHYYPKGDARDKRDA
jgi:small conductance mechanosensitive channel